MKRNAIIGGVLVLLALVPVTATFLSSGEHEDAVAPRPETPSRGTAAPGKSTGRSSVPVFVGFENERYQRYDAVIAELVADFNRRRAAWVGGTPGQGQDVPEITAAQVKAHMIQETGGGDVRSRAAWAHDPLQVNVPGDWNPYKKYLGIREPKRRNEGNFKQNLKAGIMLLSRKGFGVAGQPAGNRPDGAFDGWPKALQRYNGRSDKAADGRPYREAYADRILQRTAKGASKEVPIPIPTRKK